MFCSTVLYMKLIWIFNIQKIIFRLPLQQLPHHLYILIKAPWLPCPLEVMLIAQLCQSAGTALRKVSECMFDLPASSYSYSWTGTYILKSFLKWVVAVGSEYTQDRCSACLQINQSCFEPWLERFWLIIGQTLYSHSWFSHHLGV